MASAAVCDRVRAGDDYRTAGTVLLYAPLPDEVDVLALMSGDKRFCFPRYLTDRKYTAARAESLENLLPGRFGILEPTPGMPEIPAREVDLVIIPGLAFDLDCHRLGRGRGFYDRWLLELAGVKVGVGFDHQLIQAVPREDHDVRLDAVVTPSRWASSPA